MKEAAYERLISDGSSDLCSSIINSGNIVVTNGGHAILLGGHVLNDTSGLISAEAGRVDLLGGKSATLNLYPGSEFSISVTGAPDAPVLGAPAPARSEERRGGQECVRTWSSRWSPDH